MDEVDFYFPQPEWNKEVFGHSVRIVRYRCIFANIINPNLSCRRLVGCTTTPSLFTI